MRCVLPLVAMLSLAFAPAPFPKTSGRATSNQISLRTFQGRWKVVSMESVNEAGRKTTTHWNVNRIRVEDDQLTYLAGDMPIGRNRITIDTKNLLSAIGSGGFSTNYYHT